LLPHRDDTGAGLLRRHTRHTTSEAVTALPCLLATGGTAILPIFSPCCAFCAAPRTGDLAPFRTKWLHASSISRNGFCGKSKGATCQRPTGAARPWNGHPRGHRRVRFIGGRWTPESLDPENNFWRR
jgi:hypothetical protein